MPLVNYEGPQVEGGPLQKDSSRHWEEGRKGTHNSQRQERPRDRAEQLRERDSSRNLQNQTQVSPAVYPESSMPAREEHWLAGMSGQRGGEGWPSGRTRSEAPESTIGAKPGPAVSRSVDTRVCEHVCRKAVWATSKTGMDGQAEWGKGVPEFESFSEQQTHKVGKVRTVAQGGGLTRASTWPQELAEQPWGSHIPL